KTPDELETGLEFRRVLFRSAKEQSVHRDRSHDGSEPNLRDDVPVDESNHRRGSKGRNEGEDRTERRIPRKKRQRSKGDGVGNRQDRKSVGKGERGSAGERGR